jgi:hypothetical protein
MAIILQVNNNRISICQSIMTLDISPNSNKLHCFKILCFFIRVVGFIFQTMLFWYSDYALKILVYSDVLT